ncbi:MAG TPA: hypothetical protein PK760_08250, partial [Flavobacteriales bacterium]|nr:hypothetical protein [Flavobacteriales bacterium]
MPTTIPTPPVHPIDTYVKANEARFLDELLDLLRIPSVSADPKYKADEITVVYKEANTSNND